MGDPLAIFKQYLSVDIVLYKVNKIKSYRGNKTEKSFVSSLEITNGTGV